jgi:adenylate cyclase
MPNPDVFVSYSRDDKPRVAPLVHEIKQAGHSVWWDPELQVGSRFERSSKAR